MKCSLCKKSASKLVTHRLCDCCTQRLEDGCRESIFFVSSDQAVRKVECEGCLEPVLKDDLEHHREMCAEARVVFRCTVCDADYLKKTALFQHLKIHEILDEAQDEHYRETKVTHGLHKCVLCNDQRGYQESLYWNHVHEDHDGYFLRCLNCSESFRSHKLMIDHDENHCKIRIKKAEFSDGAENLPSYEPNSEIHCEAVLEQSMEFADCDESVLQELETEQDDNQRNVVIEQPISPLPSRKQCSDCGKFRKHTDLGAHHCKVKAKVEKIQSVPSKTVREQCLDCGREFRKYEKFLSHRCKIDVKVQDSSTTNKFQCPQCQRFYKNYTVLQCHIRQFHRPSKCNICGLKLANFSQVKAHKLSVHVQADIECPHCGKKFRKNTIQNHLNSHQEASHLCNECGVLFQSNQNLQVHIKRFHTPGKMPRMKGYARDKRDKNQKNDDANINENSTSQQQGTELSELIHTTM